MMPCFCSKKSVTNEIEKGNPQAASQFHLDSRRKNIYPSKASTLREKAANSPSLILNGYCRATFTLSLFAPKTRIKPMSSP
jgi:hypothetical protein